MEEYRWMVDIAVAAITAIVGWVVGRRNRDNAFLMELQTSINTLAAKNAEQMDEILKLRDEVIKLRSENLSQSQEIARVREENALLNRQMAALREENGQLKEQMQFLTDKLEGVKTITRTK